MAIALSETFIRERALPESFRRGQEYERQGAVVSVKRRGDVLQAEVEGTQATPYRIQITLDQSGVAAAACTCLYSSGGWCKHIVATLLTYVHQPATVEDAPTIEDSLSALSREQLQRVVLRLVEYDPALADVIEDQIVLSEAYPPDATASPGTGTPAFPSHVDTQPVRRQVQAALHSLDRMRRSEAYWHIGGVVGEVEHVLDPARQLVEAGDGRAALPILEAVTEEYIDGWTMLDDSDGEVSSLFYELGPVWTEALLSAELTESEREAWVDVLADWSDGLADYGVEGAFDAAIEAVHQGWDYPPLLRVLQGEITEQGAWEDVVPYGADELAIARLNVLERQERYQEYLYLAEAQSQTERFNTMLVHLGRVAEAVEYGLSYLGSAQGAFTLAYTLLEHGHPDEAFLIAEHGLTLERPRAALAIWLRDTATTLERVDRALPAAVIACQEQPDLSTYRAVQDLSGEEWPCSRDELLTMLRRSRSGHPAGRVDIFLHEGLFEDAINAVEGAWDYALIERVVEAVMTSHPHWVTRTTVKQAEFIMDRGDSQNYFHAARWLAYTREAYRTLGQQAEWTAYLDGLIETHQRKYKLRPMLEALR